MIPLNKRLASALFLLAFVIAQTGCSQNRNERSKSQNRTARNANASQSQNIKRRESSSPSSECDPNYSGCVPIASDVDCAGGSGNGPAYVKGPVRVIGQDIYRLDRDRDGIGCE